MGSRCMQVAELEAQLEAVRAKVGPDGSTSNQQAPMKGTGL